MNDSAYQIRAMVLVAVTPDYGRPDGASTVEGSGRGRGRGEYGGRRHGIVFSEACWVCGSRCLTVSGRRMRQRGDPEKCVAPRTHNDRSAPRTSDDRSARRAGDDHCARWTGTGTSSPARQRLGHVPGGVSFHAHRWPGTCRGGGFWRGLCRGGEQHQ